MVSKLIVGQTWKLASGEIVTIVSLPDDRGWSQGMSHDMGHIREYGSYAFSQKEAQLLESKSDTTNGSILHTLLKNIVNEVLDERKADRKKAKRV